MKIQKETKGHDFNLTESKVLDPPGVEILFTSNNEGEVIVNNLRFFFLFLRILTGQRKAMVTSGPQPCDQVLTIISPRSPRGQHRQVIISAAQFQFNILLPEAPLSGHPTF